MRLLVTGARGAIGRSVVRIAKQRGCFVSGIGHGAWSGDRDLPEIDLWLNGEVSADTLSAIAASAGPPEAIIHLAGGSHVGASIAHPGEDFRRTVGAAQALLEWMRLHAPAPRLVIASTAAIYGDGHEGPIPEHAPSAPTSPYGAHKAIVELQARSYGRQFGLRSALVRLFSVYGPGLRKQIVFETAARLARGERTVSLGGSGGELRDFLFIEDAAAILLDAVPLAETASPAFNGGAGVGVSVRAVAHAIADLSGGAEIRFTGTARAGDPFALVSDPARARAAGLNATEPLAEGLARTVAWVRAQGEGR